MNVYLNEKQTYPAFVFFIYKKLLKLLESGGHI